MDLFLSRLKAMSITILLAVVAIVIGVAPFAVVWLLGEFVSENIPLIFAWLVVYGMLIFWLYRFVNWLIIEPIKSVRKPQVVEKDSTNW